MSEPQNAFFKIKNTKRATKKNTGKEKYKKNGKYTGRGMRAKEAIIASSQRANDNMNNIRPRETVVGTVLNRDKMQSIALPPKLQKEKIKMAKNHNKRKPKLNTSDEY